MQASWLSELPLDSVLTVKGLQGDFQVVTRLQQLGFREDLIIRFQGRAPFGGPYLFRVGAMTIALRAEETQCLILKK